MPRDFQPHNEDGEVAEFQRASVSEVIEMLRGDADFTLDASLVMLSFLERREYMSLLANGDWRGGNEAGCATPKHRVTRNCNQQFAT